MVTGGIEIFDGFRFVYFFKLFFFYFVGSELNFFSLQERVRATTNQKGTAFKWGE